MAEEDMEEALELPPNTSLKEKIGKNVNINEILSTNAIRNSQKVLLDAQKDFLVWVKKDLLALENAYAIAEKNPAARDECIDEINKLAFSLKSQAGTFGFELGSSIAKLLYDFCQNDFESSNPNHLLVVRKHIDALITIFHQELSGDGNPVAIAVHQALCKLVEKFR